MSEIEQLLDYGAQLGVYSYFIYLFVPVGRGELVRDDALDTRERAELLELLVQKQHEMSAILIPVAMPEYWAYALHQRGIRHGRLIRHGSWGSSSTAVWRARVWCTSSRTVMSGRARFCPLPQGTCGMSLFTGSRIG